MYDVEQGHRFANLVALQVSDQMPAGRVTTKLLDF
jgi:hypothetical protein